MRTEDYTAAWMKAIEPLAKAGMNKTEIRMVLQERLCVAFEAFRVNPHADNWLALELAMAGFQYAAKNYKGTIEVKAVEA